MTDAMVGAVSDRTQQSSKRRKIDSTHIGYRITGHTIFPLTPHTSGIRFETSYGGKYFEQYYVVVEFDAENNATVFKHTLPPFIPVAAELGEWCGVRWWGEMVLSLSLPPPPSLPCCCCMSTPWLEFATSHAHPPPPPPPPLMAGPLLGKSLKRFMTSTTGYLNAFVARREQVLELQKVGNLSAHSLRTWV
jgi:hypothetical protein